MCAAAVLAGMRSFTAIAGWGRRRACRAVGRALRRPCAGVSVEDHAVAGAHRSRHPAAVDAAVGACGGVAEQALREEVADLAVWDNRSCNGDGWGEARWRTQRDSSLRYVIGEVAFSRRT